MPVDVWWLLPFVFAGAALYSSVGHGGATVYLAILTLAGYRTGPLTTTILVLNIVAAGIGFVMFGASGHLRWKLLAPFVVTSVPFAYLGGLVPLSTRAQSALLAVALLAAAARFLFFSKPPNLRVPFSGPAYWVGAPVLGAVLGFLAGATGIGGGIFLSPILFVLGWADVRGAASVASAFIVLNSIAGLAAKLPRTPLDPGLLAPMVVVVIVGALLGSFFGARRLAPRALQVLLGCVLVVAGLKARF
ncbi:MAG: sulfite exporter TauE/SafE family protein [Thermoplasmatota archaeon]